MSRLRATLAGERELMAAHQAVRDAGLDVEDVFSPVPVELVGMPVSPVRRFVLFGGIAGGLSALALTIGTALSWPLIVSGKPVVSMPPFLIITFELTILLAAVIGLVGFLMNARLPSSKARPGYAVKFGNDAFGLVLSCPQDRVDEASGLLVAAGATEVAQLDEEARTGTNPGARHLGALLLIGGLAALASGCGFSVALPTDMVETPAVHHDEELRLPAEGTLHRNGEVEIDRFLAAMSLQNPVAPDDAAAQQGERLFAIYCAPCHGSGGAGDGVVAEYFGERPPTDLAGARVRNQLDGYIYATIRNGGGNMPGYGHALSPDERWAIVHFIRRLQERQP